MHVWAVHARLTYKDQRITYEASCLLTPFASQRLNSGHQTWQQTFSPVSHLTGLKYIYIKGRETEDMAPWLRIALAEDPSSVPSMHVVAHKFL